MYYRGGQEFKFAGCPRETGFFSIALGANYQETLQVVRAPFGDRTLMGFYRLCVVASAISASSSASCWACHSSAVTS